MEATNQTTPIREVLIAEVLRSIHLTKERLQVEF
jgi:hypothetical protein